jgi:uncharacterized membrane protein
MVKQKKSAYLRALKYRLNLPKDISKRIMSDFESDIDARLESGMSWDEVIAELGSAKKASRDINEQMREFAFRKSPWRYFFGVIAVISVGWLVLYGILQRFGMLLNTLHWSFSPSEAASIGIIGGSDGPTAIFVTGKTAYGFPDWDVILVGLILVVSVLAYLRLRKCKQK